MLRRIRWVISWSAIAIMLVIPPAILSGVVWVIFNSWKSPYRWGGDELQFVVFWGLVGAGLTAGELWIIIPMIVRRLQSRREAKLKSQGCCIRCGYDIRGSVERCSECGEKLPKRRRRFKGVSWSGSPGGPLSTDRPYNE